MSSKLKVLVPAIAAGTVAVGGGAAYYFLKVQPSQDVANPLSSFQVLPKETIAAGYLSLDESRWDNASQFGKPEAREALIKQWDEFKAEIEKNPPSGEPINFDEDIKPWLGSVTFAGIQDADQEPGFLAVVGIKDKLEALKFATRQKDEATDEVIITQFEGVDVYEFQGNDPMFLAILDNHLVLSPQKAQVESAIQTEKNGESILSVAEIKQSLEESISVKNPIAVGFAQPSVILDQVANSPNGEELDQRFLEEFKKYKAISGAIGIENNGFRLKNVLKHNLDSKWQFDPLPGKVISQFPDNTFAFIHTGYFKQSWELIESELKKDPAFSREFENFQAEFKRETQLDLNEDLLSWMDGEVGIGLIPANDGLLSQIGFGGAIAIKSSDRGKTDNALDKINGFARGNGAEIKKTDLNGVAVTQWGIPLQPSLVTHGWIDDSTLVFTIGDSIANTMTQGPSSSIKENAIFTDATKTIGSAGQGLFFLNTQELLNTLRSSPTMSIALSSSPEVDSALSSIQGFAIANSQPNPNTVIGEALLTFTKE